MAILKLLMLFAFSCSVSLVRLGRLKIGELLRDLFLLGFDQLWNRKATPHESRSLLTRDARVIDRKADFALDPDSCDHFVWVPMIHPKGIRPLIHPLVFWFYTNGKIIETGKKNASLGAVSRSFSLLGELFNSFFPVTDA